MKIKSALVKNFFSLPGISLFLVNSVSRQRKFLKHHLEPDIKRFKENNDGSLKPADFKKFINYYALGVTGILGEAFGVLRGKPMSREERFCLSYLGGISGLLDDLFDDPEKEETHLKDFVLHPQLLSPSNKYEELLLHCYTTGLQYSLNPQKIKSQAFSVFQAQQESVFQHRTLLSADDLKRLTWEKGGTSFIFYRLCLHHKLSASERNFLYDLGGVMQLGNDIFDVWEDFQAGIRTPATEVRDIGHLRKLFQYEMDKSFKALAETEYVLKNKKKFERIIRLALARVFVCLDQFESLQKSTDNIFDPSVYSRKQLICDMENPKNKLRAINHYLNFDSRPFLV